MKGFKNTWKFYCMILKLHVQFFLGEHLLVYQQMLSYQSCFKITSVTWDVFIENELGSDSEGWGWAGELPFCFSVAVQIIIIPSTHYCNL